MDFKEWLNSRELLKELLCEMDNPEHKQLIDDFKNCWELAQKEVENVGYKAYSVNKRTLESEQKLLEKERKSARKELAHEIIQHLQSNEFHTADSELVKFLEKVEKQGAD